MALPNGRVAAQAPLFRDGGVFLVEAKRSGRSSIDFTGERIPPPKGIGEVYQALALGTRDYVRKNRFTKVALGLSGGIDSSVVAAIAVEALGAENVVGITMPSRFNLNETRSDAALLAKNLGIRFLNIPIQSVYEKFLETLAPTFSGAAPNIAEENLQARIRGTILMTLSNKFGWLILTTGNKSETSTGYSTLYGDTAGGFAIIKDVLKTTVYALASHINTMANKAIIPDSVIRRAPTAELRENQKDEDSLGPYADLDPIIVGYIEQNLSATQLARRFPGKENYIHRVLSMIDRNEYKRRQAPPGIKISPRAFGRDHRMPITNRYGAGK